jgi:hypothetical protein
MKIQKIFYVSNNWLWILVSEDGEDYFYRYDQLSKLRKIEKREREKEGKTIEDLKGLNIKLLKNPCNGFFLAQYLKEEKWIQLLCQNYYLDPTMKKHIVNR